jgi:hypothetical protein
MREDLENIDLGQYKVLDKKLIQNVDSMLSVDMTNLMQMISKEEFDSLNKRQVNGGAFSEFFSQYNLIYDFCFLVLYLILI